MDIQATIREESGAYKSNCIAGQRGSGSLCRRMRLLLWWRYGVLREGISVNCAWINRRRHQQPSAYNARCWGAAVDMILTLRAVGTWTIASRQSVGKRLQNVTNRYRTQRPGVGKMPRWLIRRPESTPSYNRILEPHFQFKFAWD